mmetsp:Transcript_108315/g.170818  ORF Transcript_108315/g.170818 Transcript_108315/m.170818 type:complete len:143 (+) Transcript_108315:82-510(+)
MASRQEQIQRTRNLYASNSFQTRSSVDRAREARELVLDRPHTLGFGRFNELPRREDGDYPYASQATTFARGGIQPGQGIQGTYIRDCNGGAWFKDKRDKPWSVPLQKTRSLPLLKNEIHTMSQVPMSVLSLTLRRHPPVGTS